jgi:glutamate racemase
VIGTAATIRSHAYFQAIKEEDPFVEVLEQATPDLVPLVEAGQLEGALVEEIVRRSIAPIVDSDHDPDTLLLGCTHYPLLAPIFRAIVGSDVAVIDTATATASALAHLLEMHDLNAPAGQVATHVQLTTGDLAAFSVIAQRLFGPEFARVEPVAVAGVA